MPRHKHHQADTLTDPALDISSLIDICFLLLIYFIATSTIAPRESQLDLRLPGTKDALSLTSFEAPLITISSSGTIFSGAGQSLQTLDSDPTSRDLPILRSQLDLYTSACRAAGSQPTIQIHANPGTSHQRVIDVLNTLATVDIKSVAFTDLL